MPNFYSNWSSKSLLHTFFDWLKDLQNLTNCDSLAQFANKLRMHEHIIAVPIILHNPFENASLFIASINSLNCFLGWRRWNTPKKEKWTFCQREPDLIWLCVTPIWTKRLSKTTTPGRYNCAMMNSSVMRSVSTLFHYGLSSMMVLQPQVISSPGGSVKKIESCDFSRRQKLA